MHSPAIGEERTHLVELVHPSHASAAVMASGACVSLARLEARVIAHGGFMRLSDPHVRDTILGEEEEIL